MLPNVPIQDKSITNKIIILYLTSYTIFMYHIYGFRYMDSKQDGEFLDEELEEDDKDTEYLDDEFEEDDTKSKLHTVAH
ncbi:MAG: hypothetical protein KGH99_02230 [Thaumarchaeota archaeon]|nr:hypothetical protein [Nitrososphaerota archaeon]